MSNLKHLSLDELIKEEADCQRYICKMENEISKIEGTIKPFTDKISSLKSKINGQYVRLEWILKYKKGKTHVKMTQDQLEEILGYKVIITN